VSIPQKNSINNGRNNYSLQLLIDYSQGLKYTFILILLTSIFIGLYPSVLAILFTAVIETVIGKQNLKLLAAFIGGILLIYGIASVCEAIRFTAIPKFIASLTCQMRADMYHRFLVRTTKVEQKDEEGRQLATFLRDLAIIEDMLHRLLDVSTIYLSRLLTSFLAMFYYNMVLGLLILLVFLAVQVFIWQFNKNYIKASKARSLGEDGVSEMLAEAIDGAEVIQAHNASQALNSRFTSVLRTFEKQIYREMHFIMQSAGIPRIVGRMFIYILICISFVMADLGYLTIGEVTGIISIGTIIVDPMQEVNIAWSKWTRASVSMQRQRALKAIMTGTVNNLGDANNSVNDPIDPPLEPDQPSQMLPLQQSFCLHDVTFSYPNSQSVLDKVNLTLPAKGLFVVKGANGAGKSTLFKLLAGDLTPSQGLIDWDEQNLQSFTFSERKKAIRLIPQRSFLFNTTVFDNIVLCNPGVELNQVRETAAQFDLLPFLNNLPNGLETIVGRKGSSLSGGQAQLVCLLRALMSDPSVLLMDEPFAALDSTIKGIMMSVLPEIAQQRLVLVILHDSDLIQYGDGIIYMENQNLRLV
jgi:ATP-binding cassette, subfamily B, bacterial